MSGSRPGRRREKMRDGFLTGVPEIRDGWMDGAAAVPSPHFGKRPGGEVSLLVIHNISLPPRRFGGNYVELFFTGKLPAGVHPYFDEIRDMEVSSHLYIRRTGRVIQFVSFDDRAWHAGKSVFRGREACNDFAVGVELEGADDVPYADAQYRSLRLATLALTRRYPLITPDRIVGHEHIAPGRKTDPGPAFDWKRYLGSLACNNL